MRHPLLSLVLLLLVSSPSGAASPRGWIARLGAESGGTQKRQPQVLALWDDWQTGGSWRGRYGRSAWVLCGMSGMWDYTGGAGIGRFTYRPYIGENCDPGDGLRAWMHWPYLPAEVPAGLSAEDRERLRGPLGTVAPAGMDAWEWADVRRVLLNPVDGGRRQTSWDDHAEGYSPWFSRQGPHLYLDLEFPDGQYLLSLYFVNKDAHWGGVNRFRDYQIVLKAGQADYGRKAGWEAKFEAAPALAESRVCDHYAGVHKRFYVRGPVKLTLRVDKGDSINASVSGIFVDEFGKERFSVVGAADKAASLMGLKSPVVNCPVRTTSMFDTGGGNEPM